MLNDITTGEIALILTCSVFFLSLVLLVDRYLKQRRSSTQNADYLARVNAESAYNFQRRFNQRSEWQESVFDIGGVTVSALSRRSVVRDHLGRVIALHNEEVLTPASGGEFSQQRRPILLPAAA